MGKYRKLDCQERGAKMFWIAIQISFFRSVGWSFFQIRPRPFSFSYLELQLLCYYYYYRSVVYSIHLIHSVWKTIFYLDSQIGKHTFLVRTGNKINSWSVSLNPGKSRKMSWAKKICSCRIRIKEDEEF